MTRRVVILSWRPAPAALHLGNTRSRNFMSSTNTASEVDLLLDYLFAVADLVEVHFASARRCEILTMIVSRTWQLLQARQL